MKTLGLYYVYDNLGETVITPPIPCANDLVAAIGFRDTYMKKDSKYNYKALDLVCFGRVFIDEDGCMKMDPDLMKETRWLGAEILSFIANKSAELGIDDSFVEEEKEEE